jgi:type IV secretion system protein VirB11
MGESSVRGPASSLAYYCRPLALVLADPTVTEICVQEAGSLMIERSGGWERVDAAWATGTWARHFVQLVATATDQRVGPDAPLLSASLPTGERVQAAIPPATGPERVVFAIRRPNREAWSLADLGAAGLFGGCQPGVARGAGHDADLLRHFAARDWRAFLSLAVTLRLNIVISGATGSGKTTLTKALISEIPADERLISIEDAAELDFTRHPNVVRLFYSKDGQGVSRVTPKQLLEASLRLRPDRILLAEVRGEEAYYFLRNVSSGHPGSITSVHAGSAALAFEQLSLLVKESAPGREMGLEDIKCLLRQVVDVVVQCARLRAGRRVGEVWWRDAPAS